MRRARGKDPTGCKDECDPALRVIVIKPTSQYRLKARVCECKYAYGFELVAISRARSRYSNYYFALLRIDTLERSLCMQKYTTSFFRRERESQFLALSCAFEFTEIALVPIDTTTDNKYLGYICTGNISIRLFSNIRGQIYQLYRNFLTKERNCLSVRFTLLQSRDTFIISPIYQTFSEEKNLYCAKYYSNIIPKIRYRCIEIQVGFS